MASIWATNSMHNTSYRYIIIYYFNIIFIILLILIPIILLILLTFRYWKLCNKTFSFDVIFVFIDLDRLEIML